MTDSAAVSGEPVQQRSPPGLPVPPRPPQALVPRPALLQCVEAGVAKGMVVVSAPAGSGKTMLLASWAAARPAAPAWLSADPEDAEPGQFWAHVLGALQATADLPAGCALATMQAPPRMDRRFVTQLVDACGDFPHPVALVLDDLHRVIDTPTMDTLADAMRRGLGNLHLVISTRVDPPLPLQRLRLEDRLTELHGADLAFDRVAAEQLLIQHHLRLRRDQLDHLVSETEGWVAGLRLAALALHSEAEVDRALSDLSGHQRNVADYFVEEVLAHVSPELSEFLLGTCVARRICADLANHLTGRTDGQAMLEQLERENLFIVALDDRRSWYRYHHLFGNLLLHRLRVDGPERSGQLHRRAADWFARQGDLLESARHLADAAAWAELARFMIRAAGAKMLGMERHALVELLRRLPMDLVRQDPELATAAAIAAYAEYDAPAVRAHVSRARELLGRLAPADAAVTDAVHETLETVAAWMEGDADGQIAHATAALAKLGRLSPADVPALAAYRSGTTLVLGMGTLWTGRLDEAEALLTGTLRAVTEARALTPLLAVHLHGHLAVLRTFQGALHKADEETRTTLATAKQSGWLFLPQSAMAFLAESLVAMLRGDHAACAVAVERGLACIGDLEDRFPATGLTLVRVRLEATTGDADAAFRILAELRRRTSDWKMPWFLERWCELIELEAALASDDADLRHTTVARLGGDWGSERPEAHRLVLLARAALMDGNAPRCLELAERVTTTARADRVPTTDAWLLAALAHDRMRRDTEASAALHRALELAAPEGIARPFLLAGERVRGMLARHLQISGERQEFVKMLLDRLGAAGETEPPNLLEPLTDRERSVLLLLPTMMTNNEIGDELFLSVNTVKVHLKSLYRKLDARTRREAVLRARDLGLLSGPGTPDIALVTRDG